MRKIKNKKFPPNSSDKKRWKKQKFIYIEVDTVGSGSSFFHVELLSAFLAVDSEIYLKFPKGCKIGV